MPTAASAPLDPLERSRPGQAEVGRAEGHVVADRRHEQLVVGILEHDADAAADLPQVALGDGEVRRSSPGLRWGR